MYFSEFPKIYYDFPNYTGDDTFLQVLTDITANVRIRKKILEDVSLYDEYDIKEGETPEIIAEKIYGNPEYHWVIMLANQRYDYLKDFPMTSAELHQHVANTYGQDHIYDVHHYEQNGIYIEASGVLKVPKNVIKDIKINDYIIEESYANARVESINADALELVVRLDYGRFVDGKVVTVQGIREDENKNITFAPVLNFLVPTNGFTLNSAYEVITNYDHELRLNEEKRRIKIISPRLIEQLLREYKTIMG